MYLGTNEPTLQTARAIRDEEIELARQRRTARDAARNGARGHRFRWRRSGIQLSRSG